MSAPLTTDPNAESRTGTTVHDTLGRPLKDLRISVMDECNFRCTYCMPSEIYGPSYEFLEKHELLSFEEIERVARAFARLGVDKIKLTGGEPLLRPWLPKLVAKLTAIPGIDDVALITNGHHLPPLANRLKSAGLNRITVSLDALDPDQFSEITGGRGRLDRVLAGIHAAERAGFNPIKINVVVQRGMNEDQIVPIADHFRGGPFIVRYIEFMDVGTVNGWRRDRVVPAREIADRIHEYRPIEPVDPNYPGEVAERYRYVDGSGEVGIIASVTRPFCGTCSRIRLSADGRLFTCLFANKGRDLRTDLRSGTTDGELEESLRRLWNLRGDRYSEERAEALDNGRRSLKLQKVEMFHIGG